MSENNDQITSIQDMANWLRLLGMKQLVTVLESDVNDNKRKQAYQHSDGQRTTRDIAKLVGTDHSTISDWWKKWILLGLGEYKSASGGKRFQKSFDLEALGILANKKSKKNGATNSTDTTSEEEENE
jgi:hypothetical protein